MADKEALLKVRGLNKYFGKRKILDDISFDVYRGEVFGFLGPNGAGKTTTIKIIMGFLFADSGSIVINGYDIKKNYEKAMANLGGIVENPELYKELSGRTNLEMYARLHDGVNKSRIDEVVAMVGMQERINEKVKKYSLGMKQRTGLAQAMLHKPSLLILDEPTNGLDPAGIKELRDIFKKLAHEQNTAVFVSSHMLSEMELMCDRVAIINNGKIMGEEPIDNLLHALTGGNVYRFYLSDISKGKGIMTETGMIPKKETAESLSGGYLDVPADRNKIPALCCKLVNADVGIYEIKHIENSLEDAFMSITGGGLNIG